ncbi:MAG: LysE family transporter [Spirochaetales bacterium]|nr:LysE family transporter [Spirochaetales bacterium]
MFNLIPTLTFVFVTTFTPGPNNTMSLISGKNNGYKKSIKFMLGIFSGFFILMILCGLFNRILFTVFPFIKPYISIAGSLYMLYLAIIILKSDFGSKSYSIVFSYKKGLLLQFMNVKVIMYGLVLYGTFIFPYFDGILVLIFSAFLLALTSFTSISLWSFSGSRFSSIINRYPRFFSILTAGLMAFSSISILYPVIVKLISS